MIGAGQARVVTVWAVVQLLGRGLAACNARVTRRMQGRRGLTKVAIKGRSPETKVLYYICYGYVTTIQEVGGASRPDPGLAFVYWERPG